jgi:hypothetical protein
MVDHNYSHTSVFSLIKEIEDKIDFQDWVLMGINIWPVIRPNLRTYIKNSTPIHKSSSISQKRKLFIQRLFPKLFLVSKGLLITLPKIIFSTRIKYIYMTDGSSIDCVNGKWGDKFLRGLKYEIPIEVEDCLILSPIKINKKFTPLEYKIIDLSWLDALSELLAGIYIRITRKQLNLQGYSEFIKIITNRLGNVEDFSHRGLTYRLFKIKIFVIFFDILLRMKKIKKAFIVSFYHDMGFAMNITSKNNNIVSVDIQHGTITSHETYCGWNTIKKGYKEFPTEYYTWDDGSTNIIKKWASKTDLHTVIQTGNLSHKIWLNDSPIALEYDLIINRLKKEMTQTAHGFDILVSLQPVSGFKENWNVLANVIKKQKLNVRWWLRHHPTTMSEGRQEGLDGILNIKDPNVDYDNASNLPLCSLLRNIDLHITVRSSTYLECKAFGVKTLFISEYGQLEHKDSKDDKNSYYAYSEDSIIKTLQTLMKEYDDAMPL